MTDLLARLRDADNTRRIGESYADTHERRQRDREEAADRIAQLEAALRKIDTISWTPRDRETYQDLFAEAQNIASAALGEDRT